jgi:putative transposase
MVRPRGDSLNDRRKDNRCHGKDTAKRKSYSRCGRWKPSKKVSEVCREVVFGRRPFYIWKRRYAGTGLNELRELRQLREENRKPKTMIADLSLDKHILQDVLSKKA